MVTTYEGYRITELRRYATEYKIAGRSKMTGDELLAAVRAYWTAQRDAQQDELLAGGPLTIGTVLRHKSSGYLIRVTGETYIWESYGAVCVPAEYVELDGWGEDQQSRIARAAYANEGDARRLAQGDMPRHPIYQYERVTDEVAVAGIDMDAIHVEALAEDDARYVAEGRDLLGWARNEDAARKILDSTPPAAGWRFADALLSTETRQAALDILHAEALAEYREITRAARKADADAYQRELARDLGLPASAHVGLRHEGEIDPVESSCTHGDGCSVHPDVHALHNLDDEALRLLGGRRLRRVEDRMRRARQSDPDSDRQRLDDLIERLCQGIPESWDGEDSADSILVDYVRTIESRLLARGGTLEQWEGDPDA